ncbi:MAG: hypothetical protein Q9195_003210 [Heterodermia aff. obscurata]
MLDLWGRGYSDAPLNIHYDVRLYNTQISFAIDSSPLEWKSQGFSMIGYSLGGGIAMAYAAHHPQHVESIVLLAPGGILRQMPDDYKSLFFRYPSLCSSELLRRLVAKAQGVELRNPKNAPVVQKEVVDLHDEAGSRKVNEPWYKDDFNISAVVQWQFENHHGLIHTFVSNYQYGPIMYQNTDWERVGKIIKGEAGAAHTTSTSPKLQGGRILAIFGIDDNIVNGREVSKDLLQLIGAKESTEIRWISGGHDFPVHHSDEVVDHIASFWDLASRDP